MGHHNHRIYIHTNNAVMEEQKNLIVFEKHDPQMSEKICAFAKQRRASLGISQGLMSNITGIRQGHISDIELFKRPNVSFNIIARLLIELNCRVIIEPLD